MIQNKESINKMVSPQGMYIPNCLFLLSNRIRPRVLEGTWIMVQHDTLNVFGEKIFS